MSPREPLLVNRYRLEEPAGTGGQGTVYRAVDCATGRSVAVKLVSPSRQAGALETLRWEVAALRLTPSPGTVQLLDEGWVDDRFFLVMDWVDGRPFPGAEVPMPWQQLAPRVEGLLAALARLHARGLLHCDLKPQNVLVDANGTVTIVDLGLSQRRTAARLSVSSQGTPWFCPPEQLSGDPVTEATDLYAVGLLIVYALSGSLPGDPQTAAALLQARSQDVGPLLAPLRELAPARVCEMVETLLRVDPRQRTLSATACVELLRGDQELGIQLPPGDRLSRAQLATIFSDPLPALRAAHRSTEALWSRTGGIRERVEAELLAWRQLGMLDVTADGAAALTWQAQETLSLLRGALAPSVSAATLERLSEEERSVLQWLSVMVPFPSLELLHQHSQASTQTIRGLQQKGLVWLDDQQVLDLSGGAGRALSPPGWRARARETLLGATPPGTPGRLEMLLEGTHQDALLAETEAQVLDLLAADQPGQASALLLTIAPLLPDGLPKRLHLTAVKTALFTEGTAHTQRTQVQLGASLEPLLRDLLDAALYLYAGQREDAEALLEGPPPTEDTRRLLWSALRRWACRIQSVEREAAFLEELAPWAAAHPDPSIRVRYLSWRAALAYRKESFAQAAQMHHTAARLAPPQLRINRLLGAATAELEYGAFDAATATLAQLAPLLGEAPPIPRLLHFRLLERILSYRRAEPGLAPELEYIQIAHDFGQPYLEGMLSLTEATIAWRSGLGAPQQEEMWQTAAVLARRAHRCLLNQLRDAALLAEALAAAVSGAPRAARLEIRSQAMSSSLPVVQLQILALLDLPELINPRWLMKVTAPYPPDTWDFRREVFSINEVLDRLE